jgi:hypothetical protein
LLDLLYLFDTVLLQKKKRRKKERQIAEEQENQDEGGQRPSAPEDDFEAKFKEVLEKSKKKRYKPPVEQVVEETVEKVLDMMGEAYEDDMIALGNKQPAMKRLAILPTIIEQLSRYACARY